MMIIVHINATGVEKVYFRSVSDTTEDLCLAVWPVVRRELGTLHRKLRKLTQETLSKVEEQDQ